MYPTGKVPSHTLVVIGKVPLTNLFFLTASLGYGTVDTNNLSLKSVNTPGYYDD